MHKERDEGAQDQAGILEFLGNPASYGESGTTPVTTISTHISVIFLVGQRAFKLKRAVRLPYVDFSTPARRLAACRRELHLNRRTAPALYVGVRRITREANGHLVFDGGGDLVDAVVEMVRFNEDDVLDHLASRAQLGSAQLTDLARTIAHFHADAAISHRRGSVAGIASVLDANEKALASAHVLPADMLATLSGKLHAVFHAAKPLLDARERAGKVRRCHGDLHLRNICLLNGIPTLFDCLEFDESMATTDVLYDIAFLIMDLWHRHLRAEANLIFNRYLDENDETDGLPLMPLFMAIRACIRAHVTATQARLASGSSRDELQSEARTYATLAEQFLVLAPRRLVVIGGLSGTGKSTVAAAIADQLGSVPGARVLESDRIRKRLHGLRAEDRLPAQAYDPEVSDHVYATLAQEARAVLDAGSAVVVDAVFERAARRERIERIARDAEVPFTGIWLEALPQTLFARVSARRGDPSDATVEVVQHQIETRDDPTHWARIDANQPVGTTSEKIIRIVEAGSEGQRIFDRGSV